MCRGKTTPLPTASPSTSSLPTPLPQIHRYADIDVRVSRFVLLVCIVYVRVCTASLGAVLCVYTAALYALCFVCYVYM